MNVTIGFPPRLVGRIANRKCRHLVASALCCDTENQISGISILISQPAAADFAIPSMIAWVYRI